MQITLVISSLGTGGAERVISEMANRWAGSGTKVLLITFDAQTAPPSYPLDPAVAHICLGIDWRAGHLLHSLGRSIVLHRRLRRILLSRRPDVVISFLRRVSVRTALALRGSRIPLVISERNDPRHDTTHCAWRPLYRIAMRAAARVVAQSQYAAEELVSRLGRKVCVIPNPVPGPPVDPGPCVPDLPAASIVAMGRLTCQKGFDVLLRAFALARPRVPEWRLYIFGEGECLSELSCLRDELGLQESVRFPGRTGHPYAVLQKAGLFVLSSRYEGFPNALCEAMACGRPVIATACPGGVQDIVRDEVDGRLVPVDDVAALAEAIVALAGTPELRVSMGRAAAGIAGRFSVERIMREWNGLVEDTRRGAPAASAPGTAGRAQ